MLHQIAQLFVNDPVLTLFALLTPLAILLDVFTGMLNALKHQSFSFRMIADFARHDLHAFVMIVIATLGLIASGVSANMAVLGEKGALLALLVSILTSIGTHLQDLTGIPVAFWETALQNYFFRSMRNEISNVQPPADIADVSQMDTNPQMDVVDSPVTTNSPGTITSPTTNQPVAPSDPPAPTV